MNEKDLKIIRYLAGAMFALVGLSSILSVIFCLENSTAWGSYALTAISAILMAVSMFFIKYELLMAGAGVQVIVWFVNIFSMKLPITGWDIPKILFYILLIAGYVIIILATLRNKNACKYGFISVALIARGYFVNFLSVYVMGAILGHTSFFSRATDSAFIYDQQNSSNCPAHHFGVYCFGECATSADYKNGKATT